MDIERVRLDVFNKEDFLYDGVKLEVRVRFVEFVCVRFEFFRVRFEFVLEVIECEYRLW